jgi:hypothetical protein
MTLLRSHFGSCLFLGLLLFAVTSIQSDIFAQGSMRPEEKNPLLLPCSLFEDVGEDLGFTSKNFDNWEKIYHEKVAQVVEGYLNDLKTNADCDAENVENSMVVSESLRTLAEKLPTWKNSRSEVRQVDIGMVLLEYLRVYECFHQERFYFLSIDALDYLEGRGTTDITHPSLFEEKERERPIIERQLTLSRKALSRTLALIGSINRLIPLGTELQCIEAASLDIRNAAALAAEAGSCLPRIWNGKDPLRDLP